MQIDLGRKLDSIACPPSEKSGAEDRVIYPSLYIQGGKELKELPKEGTLTIRYRTARRSETEGSNSKPRFELELEALEILDATKEDDSEASSGEKALDALAAEVGKRAPADEDLD